MRSLFALLTRNMMRDLVVVLVFFLFVLAIENFLVILWAIAVSGQKIGQGEQTYTFKEVYSIAMLCSGAASFAGGLIGFLFGIPQSNPVVRRSETTANRVQRAEGEATGKDAGQGRELTQSASVEQVTAVTGTETAVAGPRGSSGSGLHRNTNLESISDALTKGLLAIGASQLYRIDGWVRSIAPMLGESFGPGSGGQVIALSVLTYGVIEGFLFGYLATRIYLTGVFERSDPTG